MKLMWSLVATTLFALPVSANAQQPLPPSSSAGLAGSPLRAATTVSEMEALKQMQSALRNLVVAQEKYWMEHGSYTTDMAALGLYAPGRRVPRDSAWAQAILAGSTGWTGLASHRAVKGKSCVIAVNGGQLPTPRTAKEHREPVDDGVPICDDPDAR